MSTIDNVDRPIRVGIIIPTHNDEEFIIHTIESIYNQTYNTSLLKVVIIDNGSTDKTFWRIKTNLNQYREGTVLELDNGQIIQGTYKHALDINAITTTKQMFPSAARNIGLRLIQEEVDVFAMLDGDDWYDPKKIEMSIDIFKQYPHVHLVYSDYYIYLQDEDTYTYEPIRAFNRFNLEQESYISNNNLVTKKALEYAGFYDDELRTCEDWDLWLRVTEKCLAFHIAQPLWYYRVKSTGSTFVVDKKRWQEDYKTVAMRTQQRKYATYSPN